MLDFNRKKEGVEEKYKAELKGKDDQLAIYRENLKDYRQRYIKLEEITDMLAAKDVHPVNVNIENIQGTKDVNEESRKIEVKGGTVYASGSGAFSLGDISHSVISTISQLPSSPDPNQPRIKELLAELQAAIANETNLDDEDKAEALKPVKDLAEAGKNPSDGAMKKIAKRATRLLTGMAASLPTATKFVEACNKLLPEIAKIFGL